MVGSAVGRFGKVTVVAESIVVVEHKDRRVAEEIGKVVDFEPVSC